MQVRTCWTKIAKSTMRWIAAIVGLVFILVLLQDSEASSLIPRRRWARSIDLNDVFHMWHQSRLPREVVPTVYVLKLEPFAGIDKYKGELKVNVTWMNTTDRIILNVHPHLTIDDYHVRIVERSLKERENGWPMLNVHVLRVEQPTAKRPKFVLQLQEMLDKGTVCEVSIKFTGKLITNETSGFFKSEYIDSDGQKHNFVATYLGLGQAQKVFPCMDEPLFKAIFKLAVLRPKNMTARSNTPLAMSVASVDKPDMIWDYFEDTPQMTTYQLALVVSDFESISPTKEVDEMNGTRLEIKVWGRKEYLKALEDVPDKVVTIMNYFQEYFNSSILLPKLDLMAIPSYSAAKPSDGWGLMLFKESELSSPCYWNTAYELVYQWIGQYIATYRLSDAHVNKALNSFLASMATVDLNPDEVEGKWPMTMLYSLYYELGKTEPFSRVAGIKREATSLKMELVFRMFNYTLGPDLLQEGIRNFIKENSEGTQRLVYTDEIYSRLNDVVNGTDILPPGSTINSIAVSWINRNRIPVVTVIRDYETETITFSQKVYLREAPPESSSKLYYKWDIPLVIATEDKWELDKPCRLWLTKSNEPINLTIPDTYDEDKFIIVNPEEIGMFPVNYDICNWRLLSEYLQSDKRETIPVLTRAKLIHDAWNLAYAGELCFGIALNMTLSLKEERSHVVWEPVFMMIDHIGRRIQGSGSVQPKFEAYVRTLLIPLYVELNESNRDGEPSWKTHMRTMAKHFLCHFGYSPCVVEARQEYKKWLTNEEPDKGNPVANEFICPVFKWGTDEEWEFGLQRVINFPQNTPERKQNERTYLLKSLAGCTKDKRRMERLLHVIFEKNGNFSDSDIRLIFTTLTGDAVFTSVLSNFLTKHWDTVKPRFENNTQGWNKGIMDLISSVFNNSSSTQEEEKTASSVIVDMSSMTYEKEWELKNLPVIESWLNEYLCIRNNGTCDHYPEIMFYG
nr:aminopeptidase N [Megalopta genalis]